MTEREFIQSVVQCPVVTYRDNKEDKEGYVVSNKQGIVRVVPKDVLKNQRIVYSLAYKSVTGKLAAWAVIKENQVCSSKA